MNPASFSGFAFLLLMSGHLMAQKPYANEEDVVSGNPIIRHIRTADPSAQVWNDGKVWVYTSHDQDDAEDYSTMDGYRAFSSEDMVHWTDHGEILHSRDVSWKAAQGAWMFAPDAAYKDGTYYLYFPTMAEGWRWRVGVATSERPEGPFNDVGHHIEGTDHIDPACFVDDDGQAYLIWGGDFQSPRIARLKENMTELAEAPRFIEYGAENFGEGAFMHKRDGVYYFSYTCQSCYPYGAYYAMGDNPYGPFEYKGELKRPPPGAQDHHSIIEYHGQSYYFYHTGNYQGGSIHRRNVCVDSLYYREDGTMQTIIQTTTGVGQDPIGMAEGIIVPGRIEAEDYFMQEGTTILQQEDKSMVVNEIDDGDWIEFVLEVLTGEIFHASIKVSDPLVGSVVYLLADEVVVDTLIVKTVADTLTTDLFLYQGKHVLKLLYENPGADTHLMAVDWIDLYGETTYRSIKASATEGGSVDPEGILYVEEDDSLTFTFDWAVDFRPDSLVIDGISESFSNPYTFSHVAENHTIEARFAACSGTRLAPGFIVNEESPLSGSEISLIEGDQLKLWVSHEGRGALTWTLPNGTIHSADSIQFDQVSGAQDGVYSALFISEEGCKSKTEFNVTVRPLILEVYQAERWYKNYGTQSELCSDAGGTHNLTYIENDDWCSYAIDIEETGFYDITARVATAGIGGEIEFSVRDQLLATVPVSGSLSDDGQDWYTTLPVEALFEKGSVELKLTFKGSDGYLFNLNWFDLEYNRALPSGLFGIKDPSALFYCYSNPDGAGFHIKYTVDQASYVSISVLNMVGQNCRTLVKHGYQQAGNYQVNWDGRDDTEAPLPDGIYLVIFNSMERREVQKVLFVR